MTQPSTKLHHMLTNQVLNAEVRVQQIDAVAIHLADLMNQVVEKRKLMSIEILLGRFHNPKNESGKGRFDILLQSPLAARANKCSQRSINSPSFSPSMILGP